MPAGSPSGSSLRTPTPPPVKVAAPTATRIPTRTATRAPAPVPTKTPTKVATPTPALNRHLATGTFLKDSTRNGLGELTVKNGRDLDAVAALTTLDDDTVVSAYIQAGDSFTIAGIRDGTYYLYFTSGEDWDDEVSRFTRKARLSRFEDTLTFQTTTTAQGRQYKTF
ncbi:MAG: hypothetical protein M1531_02015 [Chloroflexi bacterium]|nr:hypothetical protein [Chloroflexota bacterium]